MKLFTLLLLTINLSFAALNDLHSYQASFKQVVTDQENISITYEGSLALKEPHFALWVYTKPLPKSVYLIDKEISIVEPELEQVIRKKNATMFSLFSLIKEAKAVSKNRYETIVNEAVYTLEIKGDILQNLSYTDEFENRVKISFSNCKPNAKLAKNYFKVTFSEDFDIISE